MRKKAIYLGVMCIYVFAFFLALTFRPLGPSLPPESEKPYPSEQKEEDVPKMYIVSFKCGHESILSPSGGKDALLGLLGLGPEDNVIIWGEELLNTSATGLMQNGYVDHDCRECQSYIFVGVKDGYVAVYKGLPRPDAELREVTDIPISRLPLDLQEELKRGIMIRSEDDLARFLEGIDR